MKVTCCTLVGNEVIDLDDEIHGLAPEHRTLEQISFSMSMGRWFKTTSGGFLNPSCVVKIFEFKESR